MNLATFAVSRPVTISMFFLGMAMMGLFAGSRLALEEFPEMEIPFVGIGIPYPNATPEEVEENLAKPVEEALSLMSGVQQINTSSYQGYLWVSVLLDFTMDIAGKGIEAKDLIENTRNRLPESVRYIELRQADPNAEPMLNVMFTAPNLDKATAFERLDQEVKQRIERIQGVNSVELFGADERYVMISLNQFKLESLGLDMFSVRSRLQAENFFTSAGGVEVGLTEFRVRPVGQFNRLADIENLSFGSLGIKLRDFATVEFVPQDRADRRRVNGADSLGMSVFKKPEANLVAVAQAVEDELEAAFSEADLADIIVTPVDSAARGVITALSDLRDSGILGGFLSLVTLLLFIRRWRSSLVIAATVPLSLCATLGVMFFMGMTLNILSLVGLMLAVGLLVDNSVVASEAIDYRRRAGLTPKQASVAGVKDINMAITAGTLTTVIVFVPSFMTDIQQVAVIQQNIAIPLCVSLLASLLIAQTLVPTAAARLIVEDVAATPIIDRIARVYTRLISLTLRHRLIAFVLSCLVLLSSIWAYQQLDVNMNPDSESPRLDLRFYMRGSVDIDGIESFVDELEDYLIVNKERFYIKDMFSRYDVDRGNISLVLYEDAPLSPKVIERMIEAKLPVLPDVRVRFGGRHRGFGGGNNGLSLRLIGPSTDVLIEESERLIEVMETVDGLTNVRTNSESRRQEVVIRMKPEAAGLYNITARQIAQSVSTAFGIQLSRGLQQPNREYEIWMGLKDGRDATLTDLRNLPLLAPGGDRVALTTVADLEIRSSLRSIRRENRETEVQVQFDLSEGTTPDQASALVEALMEDYQLPPGYRSEQGPGFSIDIEMAQEMLINILFAILLIYMLMAALFESVLFPIAILVSIGFSVVGVFWFLLLTGTTFTAMASTGMLLLAGIVVNNGIVLLSRIIQLRDAGVPRLEAILESGRHRLRPILMTVCTTVAGLLPLALGDVRVGGLGPSYFPMARTIIGGLVFSTLITLVVLPLIYVLLDDLKQFSYRALAAMKRGLRQV
ncbi:efflux RND transporter permease subunit [Pseudomonadales bacterium]|jgi:HAE1 family hydrophobic/amphiphilic exporter-1|nr:efflux RND transporter permease subunit [Pseudomonadales bacterium]MDC0374780.1 efflux RND transporter permease subunit [Pseudomonadales bacterium]